MMGLNVLLRMSIFAWMEIVYSRAASSEVTVDARTGEVKMHACDDLHEECERWQRRGRCQQEPEFMTENCPVSCGICTNEPEETVTKLKDGSTCEDLDENCDRLASNGNWCVDNIEYMTKNCPVTCGMCDDERNCEDLDDACGRWARRGRCGTEAIYMTQNCPLSCGICVPSNEKYTNFEDEEVEEDGYWDEFRTGRDMYLSKKNDVTCFDEEKECKGWAEHGECEINAPYMLKACPKSCNVCEVENTYGVIQDASGEDKQKVLDRLVEMKRYMEDVVAVDPTYERVKDRCQNLEKLCLFWAVVGECENNPSFMTTNCAPSCFSCDKLDILNRCPLDPDANNMLDQPGDLNRMFERIISDPLLMERYNPKVLSRPKPFPDEVVDYQEGPWVITLDTFLTDHECDALVELGAQEGYERSEDVGEQKIDGTFDSFKNEGRTSENAWCEDDCYKNATAQAVMGKIESLTGFPEKNSENLQMLKYEVGQFYQTHHDYIEHHQDRQCGVRQLTLFLYLNDVAEGGGTNFPNLDLTVMPQKGKALLWTSVLDDKPAEKDDRTDHQALAVLRGIKYGANAWLHQRDFKTPNENACL